MYIVSLQENLCHKMYMCTCVQAQVCDSRGQKSRSGAFLILHFIVFRKSLLLNMELIEPSEIPGQVSSPCLYSSEFIDF